MKDSFKKQLGERIKIARKSKGLKGVDLASHIGITRVSMVNIEKGRQACSVDKLLKICEITGVSFSYFVTDKGDEFPELRNFKLKYSQELYSKIDEIPLTHIRAFISFYQKINASQNKN